MNAPHPPSQQKLPKVAYLTAGAGGMFCGSCMRDNTLAAALTRLGVDVELIPTYTPIRTDEENVSGGRVFFGGINVYLQQKIPLLRYLPSFLGGLLDHPKLIRWATRKAVAADPNFLGALTVSMLQGTAGRQRKEVGRLLDWLEREVRPEVINFSNILIGGCIPEMRQRLGVPILVTLQGDDIFLDELPEPYRDQAIAEIRRIAREVDGFLVFSRFYAEQMGQMFEIPADKFHIVPLGLDVRDFAAELSEPPRRATRRIGYLARMAPEKGLHLLVDAFVRLREMPGMQDVELRIAGWLGEHQRGYVDEQFAKLAAAGLDGAYQYLGTVDRPQKLAFLREIDILSVPTVYHDPKGLFVLEALASGVPVVQPEHGAFPELLAATGGGRLFRSGDVAHLAETLAELLSDKDGRLELGRNGHRAVHSRFNADEAARATLEMYRAVGYR